MYVSFQRNDTYAKDSWGSECFPCFIEIQLPEIETQESLTDFTQRFKTLIGQKGYFQAYWRPDTYDLLFHNCAHAVENILHFAGFLKHPSNACALTPKAVAQTTEKIAYENHINNILKEIDIDLINNPQLGKQKLETTYINRECAFNNNQPKILGSAYISLCKKRLEIGLEKRLYQQQINSSSIHLEINLILENIKLETLKILKTRKNINQGSERHSSLLDLDNFLKLDQNVSGLDFFSKAKDIFDVRLVENSNFFNIRNNEVNLLYKAFSKTSLIIYQQNNFTINQQSLNALHLMLKNINIVLANKLVDKQEEKEANKTVSRVYSNCTLDKIPFIK